MALPALFKILGVGSGDQALTQAAGGDSSGVTRAAPQATPAPDQMPAIDPGPGEVIPPSTPSAAEGGSNQGGVPAFIRAAMGDSGGMAAQPQPQQPKGMTKLAALHNILAGGGHEQEPDPTPAMTLPGAQPEVSPSDLSLVGHPAAPNPTFQETHPFLTRLLKGLVTTAEGGAAGAGQRTFGGGFGAAHEVTNPFTHKMENLTLQKTAADVSHQQAVTDALKTTVQVRDPYGNTYQIPQAQLPGFLKTNTQEQGKNSRLATTEQGKGDRLDTTEAGKKAASDAKNAIALRKQGLQIDANGNQVPVAYEDMAPSEQAHIDLSHAQAMAQQARAELDKSKNDPNSPSYKLAMGRLRTAQQNANTALGRLGIEHDKFNAQFLGVDSKGNALPGIATTDDGTPIGTAVANSSKPSADRLKRGDLAANAIDNLNSIASIIKKNPDLVGAFSGRITNVQQMIGSNDPNIRRVGIAIHNYALASNGAHGVRSQQAIESTESEILNHWKDGPDAILGGIDEAQRSLNQFVKDQKLGNRARPSSGTPQKPAQASGGAQPTHVYDPSKPPGQQLVPVSK